MDEWRIVAPLEEINEYMETEYAIRYMPAPSEVISGLHLQYPGPRFSSLLRKSANSAS